ncbi:hypothetical protein B4N89_45940 [Embleya scabrispora]|uniref:Uncharacterized protein n=1 Tax=Embleya scabrispora TaxID=159449 RepID=A0A1T3NJB3_9ACTN|nr:hypothetical protein [Embleya scabrispora]OPC76818.1 hypothetical protein B4N89_45940 [Embleya scabrispora]
MPIHHIGDDRATVTLGVDILPCDVATNMANVFASMARLHPDVGLAHRDTPTEADASGFDRVRWMVPGVECAADDRDAWWRRVPATLGALDADAHIHAVGAYESDGVVARGRLPIRLASLENPQLARLHAKWRPPLTLGLITDARGLVVTDHGLWFHRLPPLAVVPVGYNAGAYLAALPALVGEGEYDAFERAVVSHYTAALLDALERRFPTSLCVCGRTPDEHAPAAHQVGQYADIAAEAPVSDPDAAAPT